MKSSDVWMKVLLGASIVAIVTIGGLILWLDSPQPSGVFALLVAVPFILLARFAWARLSRRSDTGT